MSSSPQKMETLSARITRLMVYPIKSCAGVDLRQAVLTPTGLEFDRAWMVVDESGEFLSQRELPRMALIQPKFRNRDLVLRAPGMLALHLALDAAEQPCRVRVWDDEVSAYDMGDLAAQWFSDFLAGDASSGSASKTPKKLRLARFDPDVQRLSSKKWTGEVDAPNQFSDGYPLLITSSASHELLNERLGAAGMAPVTIERFRPNIVLDGLMAHDEDRLADLNITTAGESVTLRPVKPCTRCSIPDVDPLSAVAGTTVSDTLQAYRQNPLMGGAVSFGMNAIVLDGAEQTLELGQVLSSSYRFD